MVDGLNSIFFFFFQAEDGIRDLTVTGVQTCALPIFRSAKGFFEVGTRPKSDVARAEVDVANARVDLIRARNALRTARVALNTAMAIEVDTPTAIQDNLVFEAVNLDRGQLRGEALRSRPEYRQSKLRVNAAEIGRAHV